MRGEDLTAWRERSDLSQVAAAEALGLSRAAYRKYEQAEDVPRVVELAVSGLTMCRLLKEDK